MKIEVFGKSIKGRRDSNQDKIYFSSKKDGFMLAVADGVGGNFGGETASKTAICQCKKYFNEFLKDPGEFKLKQVIKDIYMASVREITRTIHDKELLKNMGTTLTIVLGYKNKYVVGNIGDSRTYLIRDFHLNQITQDHSYLKEYQAKFPDEKIDGALKMQLGHIITRSINSKEEVIDIFPKDAMAYKLADRDLLLLCSDGLIIDDLTETRDFPESLIKTEKKVDKLVNRLIELAFEKGSRDNISVVIGRWCE